MDMQSTKTRLFFALIGCSSVAWLVYDFKKSYHGPTGFLIIVTVISVIVALGGVKGGIKGNISVSNQPIVKQGAGNHMNFSVQIKKKSAGSYEETSTVYGIDTQKDKGLPLDAKLCYASLGLPGIMLGDVTGLPLGLAGFFLALKKRKEALGTIYQSHFDYIIRTYIYWKIGIVASVIIFVGSIALSQKTHKLFNPIYDVLHQMHLNVDDDQITIFLYIAFAVLAIMSFAMCMFNRVRKGYNLLIQGKPAY